ncbi:sensor histidine kinase [Cohnella sp. CFH 77786]|uniref:GAF domain-containing sensor histidine kinase n=1 Tax=Cohnella sp. CFH 77786 TaxID=2662265 RepID=UPI001C609339|nr:histidine kinase [Cohnella sp. CFH 77786]MBW5445567.1 sensor histidine kinase [Cohnella sp. CFH 77786]
MMMRFLAANGRWLLYPLTALLSLTCIILYFRSVPAYYEILRSDCVYQACAFAPAPPTTPEALRDIGLSADSYAFLYVLMDVALTLIFYAAAALTLWKSRREPMGLLAVMMLVSFGTAFPSVLGVAGAGSSFVFAAGWSTFILFFLLFPNGRFVPKWTAAAAILFAVLQLASLADPGGPADVWTGPVWVKAVVLLLPLSVMAFSQIYRYRRTESGAERQQTKWVVYGFTMALVLFAAANVFYVPEVTTGALSYLYLNGFVNLSVSFVPITLTIALLRHRLWDIDPLVNRTIVYGILTICIIGIYVAAVSYLGGLFQARNSLGVSLAATAIVAVCFAPIKERLQKLVNRLLYGRKREPFAVLAELSRGWEQPMPAEGVLSAMTGTIRQTLKVPYTAISFTVNGAESIAAESGERSGKLAAFPIIHRGERLGDLLVGSRESDESFSKDDRELLEVLIRQAGPLLQGVKLTVGLKLLAEDAQSSREKLVLAREEERRRLRRNLHDDLAPRLAALALNVAAAERYLGKDPDRAAGLLSELRRTIRSSVEEIRNLVHGLRPPALDELGLVGAVRERIHELTQPVKRLSESMTDPGLQVLLETNGELPSLPAAVEVAAYRIVTEALVNVIRHAGASRCWIRIRLDREWLHVVIEDDGSGMEKERAPAANGGIGTLSMREQTAELGGRCTFGRSVHGGLRVHAALPCEAREGRNRDENHAG